MSFHIVTRRSRVVRRIAVAGATAALVAGGAIAVPTPASAEVDQRGAVVSQPVDDPKEQEPKNDPKKFEDDKEPDDKEPKDDDPKGPGGEDEPGEDEPGEDDGPTGGGIAPGAQFVTAEGQHFCTANFVYTAGDRVFIGSAAHCHVRTPEASTDLDGCDDVNNASQDLGTEILLRGFDGVVYTTTLAYSSWFAMQANDEDDPARCNLNDIALLEISPDDVDQVDPTVPVFGGPEGLDEDGPERLERVFSYQNEEDPLLPTMRAKQGVNLGPADPEGLGYIVQTTTPGFPGDSGSGYLGGTGQAFGVLSSLFFEDDQIFNGVTDIANALEYALANSDGLDGIAVVDGLEPFSSSGVPMDALPNVDEDSNPLTDLLSALPLGG